MKLLIVCLFVVVASIEAKRSGQVVLDTVKDMLDERMVRIHSSFFFKLNRFLNWDSIKVSHKLGKHSSVMVKVPDC